jgi:hypothetical protein
MARQAGDKLGPRLISLAVQHNVGLRAQLAPIEAKIHAAATKQLIDQAGEEVAGLWRPITRGVLAHYGDALPAELAHIFGRMESGTHQWESIAGNLQMASTSALSSVLSNYLFPITGPLNQINTNLPVDAQTGASAVAAGLASYSQGVGNAAVWGIRADAFEIMYKLAQQLPGAAQLFDLSNRGLITNAQLFDWLRRSGLPVELIDGIASLAIQVIAPADAALAVLRGNMALADGYRVAKANGLTNPDFDILIGNTGEPPALEELLMLWRRGKITTSTLDRGIRQSRVRDEWVDVVHMLAVEPPSAADVLNALVQGQIGQAEAATRFAESGGDPTWFETAYHSTANSPAPVQLAEMANRGIIPWTGTGPTTVSWQQGFLEGRWKDKWAPAYKQLAVYHPPPREIATLVREGGITQDEAMRLWEQAGLTPELAHVYWTSAHYAKTSAAHALAQSEIIRLYTDKAISRDTAAGMLESVHWTKTDAEWLLDIADLAAIRAALESATGKIRALFIAYKITEQTARSALSALEVPASQADQLVKIWALERGANIKTLTAAEIVDAEFYSIIDIPTAQAELEAIGYTPHDAWLLINIKAKGPIDGYPDPG